MWLDVLFYMMVIQKQKTELGQAKLIWDSGSAKDTKVENMGKYKYYFRQTTRRLNRFSPESMPSTQENTDSACGFFACDWP
jgi:hypothetical protein